MAGEESTYIVALIGVSGTIFVAILGIGVNLYKEWRDKKDQTESVRLLISLEIDKNLEMLSRLWDNIHETESNSEIYKTK